MLLRSGDWRRDRFIPACIACFDTAMMRNATLCMWPVKCGNKTRAQEVSFVLTQMVVVSRELGPLINRFEPNAGPILIKSLSHLASAFLPKLRPFFVRSAVARIRTLAECGWGQFRQPKMTALGISAKTCESFYQRERRRAPSTRSLKFAGNLQLA